MAWLILRERPSRWVGAGLALCITGLAVLVYPVAATSLQEPTGLILAFFCGVIGHCQITQERHPYAVSRSGHGDVRPTDCVR